MRVWRFSKPVSHSVSLLTTVRHDVPSSWAEKVSSSKSYSNVWTRRVTASLKSQTASLPDMPGCTPSTFRMTRLSPSRKPLLDKAMIVWAIEGIDCNINNNIRIRFNSKPILICLDACLIFLLSLICIYLYADILWSLVALYNL